MSAVIILMSDTINKQGGTDDIRMGVVIESLPNTMFRVEIPDLEAEGGVRLVIAYLAGKMKFHRIRILVGDRVDVLLDAFSGKKGRIVRRH
jgi:translation initiation factor IF-1